jgi:outer membrane protein, heavy metal efflux system
MIFRNIVLVAVVVAHLASDRAEAQQPWRLEDVYRAVRERNPQLQAMAAVVNARRALEPSAGLPPDPQVQLGAMNFSLPGFSANMPNSMVPSVQVMQMLPWFGKLGLNERIAEQATAIAMANENEAWWEVRAEAAMAFYEIARVDREVAIMRETLQLLQDFRKVAQAMYSAGQGRQADVLRAGVEVARMEAEIERTETMRVGAAARLNAAMNLPANAAAVGAVQAPPLPADVPALDTLWAWADAARPVLLRGRTEVEQAGSRVALSKKEIWPDLTLGVQYGQRRASITSDPAMPVDGSTERMGSVMLGFSVPLFAGNRQMKMREEAEAMRVMAQADLARMSAAVNARIATLVANLRRTRMLMRLYSTDVLPQAEANVQSSFSSYRVGQVDFMTLVDAQMTANKYKQELAALFAEYGSDVAQLEMAIGRELPVTVPLTLERK